MYDLLKAAVQSFALLMLAMLMTYLIPLNGARGEFCRRLAAGDVTVGISERFLRPLAVDSIRSHVVLNSKRLSGEIAKESRTSLTMNLDRLDRFPENLKLKGQFHLRRDFEQDGPGAGREQFGEGCGRDVPLPISQR